MYQHHKNINKNPLSIIINENQWRVNKVSPLYNLQYNPIKIKQYASKIRQLLTKDNTVKSAVKKIAVEIEPQSTLKRSDEDSDGLKITISHHYEDKIKVVYLALLLSWGEASELEETHHLPYLLERGEQKLGSIVKKVLQSIFDCHIKQYSFNQNHLLQLAFSLVECDTSRVEDCFTLCYTTPDVDFKDKFKFTFEIGDIHIIWNNINEILEDKSKLVSAVYKVLCDQISQMMTVNVAELNLCEVILPKAEAKSNGVIKMKTSEAVNAVLITLNKLDKY